MAQLALTFAQRTATALAQGFAAQAISSLLAKPRDSGARLETLHVLSSTDGAPMPIVFGRVRLGGQVIWADQPIEHTTKRRAGGKGGPRVSERSYTLSFAVGLCEGEISGIGRIWADGALLEVLPQMRLYTGTADQLPDPLIETLEGSANTPAFRDLAYVVFEDFALESFGNRIPQLSFEVFRRPHYPGAAPVEDKIRGVALIPGSGEFAYATEPVVARLGPGQSATQNVHALAGRADMDVALDDLQTHLPKCQSVSLVVSWFGDDVRCGNINLRPAVEDSQKQTSLMQWSVQGLNRTQVPLVSQQNGAPVFGGTPADDAVLQAIASLKARAMEVVFYPFVLMDVPPGNGLPDPYGGTEQAAFPWRGRITSFPAPGQPGTVDKTNAVTAQIDHFFGTASAADFAASGQSVTYSGPNEWSYRRFCLHYAKLCAIAGGVDAFLIGSELRALLSLRDGAGNFPAVAHLQALAAEVRTILPGAKISYAADWSEYFGYQPGDGSGDVFFHLDPLWADANVDFIGIDWYVPLADWRDGNQHLDAALFPSIYDPAYLAANMEGGEGYDWFYASDADRAAQQRTPITDGAYGKDWVFRYKDVRNWWQNQHFDRPGGVEAATPTPWVPQSKPVWFTETGCPAVDKGANEPNVFYDAKSSESALPHFSRGRRDDLIQRQYLNAVTSYWSASGGHNPVSGLYGAPMVDEGKILAWTWDARPFPQFPALESVWADGPNWELGHWLNGRMGLSELAALIRDICFRAGIANPDVSRIEGVVPGYVLNGPTNARAALELLGALYGVEPLERFDGLAFLAAGAADTPVVVPAGACVEDAQGKTPALTMPDSESAPLEVRIQFSNEGDDYQPASVSARGVQNQKRRTIDLSLPLVADRDFVKAAARDMLARALAARHSAALALPPSFLALEPGDSVQVDSLGHTQQWHVTKVDDGLHRELNLRAQFPASLAASAGGLPGAVQGPATNPGPPAIAVMDLPLLPGEAERTGPRVAAFAEPWPGDIQILDSTGLTERAFLSTPATMGEIVGGLPAGGFAGRWDNAASLDVQLYGGALASVTRADVLAGANALALAHDGGLWEVLQFQNALLTGPDRYTLWGLLRGQAGSDDALAQPVSDKALCVFLDGASQPLPLREYEIGTPVPLIARARTAEPGGAQEAPLSVIFNDRVSRWPSPVHLKAVIGTGQVSFSWIRRARSGGDYWGPGDVPLSAAPQSYRFRVYDAGQMLMEQIVAAPQSVLTDAQIDALFPSGRPAMLDIGVAQISPLSGAGIEAREIVFI